jgi:hypothetical protein
MWSVDKSRLAIGVKVVWSLIDTNGGYHIETLE